MLILNMVLLHENGIMENSENYSKEENQQNEFQK